MRVAQPSGDGSTERPADLTRGDRIRGWAVWQVPRNYENPGSSDRAGLLARRGIFVLGRIKSTRLLEKISGGCSNPWTKLAAATSAHVHRSLDPIANMENGQPAAVLASLVIGDYSGLNNATRETFQNSGHLSCPGYFGSACRMDCGAAPSVFQIHPSAGTSPLSYGRLRDSSLHVRRRLSGKHHALSLDVFAVFDRKNDLPPRGRRKHTARRSAHSACRAARLAV